ncbi:MAG TPA: branched-chain-amino acid aminotransferase [Nannocystis exedens]|nr:branched-chain-amino acid aminotransferase [Nannocystis exedens]
MTIKVYLSTAGRPLDPQEAMISVFDRGFLYGDSVYETLRTAGGHFVEMGRHLVRLRRSAAGIGLVIPYSDQEIEAATRSTCEATKNADCYVRIVVTRGTGELGLDPRHAGAPLFVVIAKELGLAPAALYERGLSARIVDIRKISRRSLDPTLKTGNYLNSIQALRQATEGSAEDAIMLSIDGAVAEGATSNVFMVKDGALFTPSLKTGLLSGITRALICELARADGRDVAEVTIWPDELRAADEVFLTSSVRGPIAVTTLDGVPVGNGLVGPVTRRLSELYRAYLEAVARGEHE